MIIRNVSYSGDIGICWFLKGGIEMKPIHPSKLDQAIEDFLTGFPFFSDLSDEEFNIVADLIGIYQMEPNEVLLKEGDKAQGVYFILDGKMNMLR